MGVYPALGLELCAGVGALGVGVGRAFPGYRTVCAVEIEPYAASVLVARQESGDLSPFPIWDDVTTFDGRPWRGVVDTVVAGFPCQDISNAGRAAGLSGERSGLWFEVLRVIREVRPRYVVLENVAALVVRGLDTVLGGLSESGYDAEWGCLSAAQVGASHGRDRLWLLAWRRDVADADLADRQRADGRRSDTGTNGWHNPARGGPSVGASLVHPVGRQLQRLGEPGVLAGAGRDAETEGDQRERGRDAAGDPGEGGDGPAVGHAIGTGLEVGRALGRNVGEECPPAERAGIALPQWPPLPADADGWRAVLERWPELAPAAFATQPAVRRVADVRGVDGRLDVPVPACTCPRTRRIAAVGNAVVPDCAATALRVLWERAFGEVTG